VRPRLNSPSLLKHVAKNSLIYALGGIITNGGSILLMPIYTRFLTPTEYGVVGSVTILNTLMISILGLGLAGAVTRFYFDSNDKSHWRSFLGTVSVFVILFGFLATALLFLFGEPILDLFFRSVRYDPYLKMGVLIGYFGIFPLIPLALMQAKGEAVKYRLLTTVSFLLLTCFMFLFVIGMRRGAIGVLGAQLVASGAMAFYYAYYVVKEGSLRIHASHLRNALRFSIPIMIYTILGITAEMSSRYLAERFTNLSDFGLYSFALLYSSGLALVASATNMAWIPVFYKNAGQPNAKYIYGQFALYYLSGMCGLGLGMSLFSREIISIVASASFYEAHKVVPVLVLSSLLSSCIWTLAANPIFYEKRTTHLLWITGISAGICILSGLWLIPNLGIMGASISLLLSNTVLVSLAFFVSQKLYPVRYNLIKTGLVVGSAVVIAIVGYGFAPERTIVGVLLKVALSVTFVASLFLYRVFTIRQLQDGLLNVRNRFVEG
jgi:O-antigen/teichoic acid export membrane protein